MKKSLISLFSISMLMGFSVNAQSNYPIHYNNYIAPANQQQYYNPAALYNKQQNTTIKTQTTKKIDEEQYKIRGSWGLDLGFEIGRKYTDFHFELTTQPGDEHGSILTWTDMIFNEYKFTANKSFKLFDAPLFVFGEYKMGNLASSGKSYDDDLRVAPYYWISVGGIDAKTSGYKIGLGWDKWFSISGFQISPVLGYTSQSHELTMKDHKYPMPNVEIYLQQVGTDGTLINSETLYDKDGNPTCLNYVDTIENKAPKVLTPGLYYYWDANFDNGDGTKGKLIDASTVSGADWTIGVNYDAATGCVIGGSYPWDLDGPSQVYNVTWSGYFAGVLIDKYMSKQDSMHFYAEYSILDYQGEGYWPFRDWGFTDQGNGYGLILNMAYVHKFTQTLSFLIKAEYENYWLDSADTFFPADDTFAAQTQSNSMKEAVWQSMGLYIGLKANF